MGGGLPEMSVMGYVRKMRVQRMSSRRASNSSLTFAARSSAWAARSAIAIDTAHAAPSLRGSQRNWIERPLRPGYR